MRIVSWNVNSLNVRLPQLVRWLEHSIEHEPGRAPDVIALQELKLEDARFPHADIEALGYHSLVSGQKTYNGVALLTRIPAIDAIADLPGLADLQRRVLAATVGDVRVINFYVVNGQAVGSEKFEYKLAWLGAAREFLAQQLAQYPRLIVLGDFNIAPDDRDVHDPVAWHERILCSTPERDALRGWLALGLHDSFRLFEENAGHYSWWDYRQAAFRRNLGLRIDLILVSDALRAQCRGAGIDAVPRTWERPSDHAPVWLDLAPLEPQP